VHADEQCPDDRGHGIIGKKIRGKKNGMNISLRLSAESRYILV